MPSNGTAMRRPWASNTSSFAASSSGASMRKRTSCVRGLHSTSASVTPRVGARYSSTATTVGAPSVKFAPFQNMRVNAMPEAPGDQAVNPPR